MTVAASVAVELLRFQPETSRAAEALQALRRGASAVGLEMTTTEEYCGQAPWLLLWGPGAPARADVMRRHTAAGGHAIALDLAYWSRGTKTRLTIDAPHPQAYLRGAAFPDLRLGQDRPVIASSWWRSQGHVIIAGIGRKAQAQYGAEVVDAWENAMAAECRRRWPLRLVVRRPKPTVVGPPVDGDLMGASLVITWHSNIAVDAIRLGIPVVCRDGAAAAVCPAEIPAELYPLPELVRDRFLANLAWFQWAPSEAAACWRFLLGLLA